MDQHNTITSDTLQELRGGSHKAFEKVYFTYKESVEFFLYKLTRSADEAQELTQIIFVNVWVKREQINPDKSIKSYLFSIARNSTINYFEHKKVVEKFNAALPPEDEATVLSDEYLIARETELLIRIAVSRMPRKRRRIFEMSLNEGKSNEEIARELNMNKFTVANHLANARKDIKELLALFILLFIIN